MLTEKLADQIPYYLTREAGEGILKELENYSDKTQIFLSKDIDGILQGDGWRGFTLYDHEAGTTRNVRALIISNSCDIDSNNKRDIPAKVTFVPLIKLSKIEKIFRATSKSEESVAQKIRDIKSQKSTSFFFVPSQGVLDEDYVAWLSDIHSMPMQSFIKTTEKQKIFSLNMTGFYLFLFKLSIHFCRFHEKVNRLENDKGFIH